MVRRRRRGRGRRLSAGSVSRRTIALLALLLAVGGGVLWTTWFGGEPGDSRETVEVVIPVGASFRAAAESLAAHDLVRWPRAFSGYATLRGRDRTIHAGTYQLARGQRWDALIAALHTGRGVQMTVTVPEGWTLRQILPHVARGLEIAPESLEVAAGDSTLLARLGIPTGNLEGYLFPDTYVFAIHTPARQVIATMVARFERAWRPEWNARLVELGRTRHEMVTLASIIEREVRFEEERPVVSAVYWNRLRIGMPLQADPTVIYALGRPTTRVLYSDLEVDSPYNTYRYPGLPPGPIGAPRAASLDAAVNPAQVPYLYFVAHPDGHHEFRTTYREHLAAIRMVREQARADSVRRARAAADAAARAAAAADTTRPPQPSGTQQ